MHYRNWQHAYAPLQLTNILFALELIIALLLYMIFVCPITKILAYNSLAMIAAL